MASVNKVFLFGNLGRDPESRSVGNGGKVVSFSLATSESWVKDGVRQERTEWHRVVIWNEKAGEVAEKYLKKGSRVLIEGSIESRKYTDKNGVEKDTTEIVLRPYRSSLTLIDKADERGGSESSDKGRPAATSKGPIGQKWEAPKSDLDDEIPF